MNMKLAAALKRDDAREAAGMHADDRDTCYTHQCWASECDTVLTVLPVAANGIVFDIRP